MSQGLQLSAEESFCVSQGLPAWPLDAEGGAGANPTGSGLRSAKSVA